MLTATAFQVIAERDQIKPELLGEIRAKAKNGDSQPQHELDMRFYTGLAELPQGLVEAMN